MFCYSNNTFLKRGFYACRTKKKKIEASRTKKNAKNVRQRKKKKSFRVAFQVVLVVKNLSASAGDARNAGSIPGSGRSTGEGNGNPLQYSCLGNPMDRGIWWDTIHGVAKSQT